MDFNFSKPTLKVFTLLADATQTKDFKPLEDFLCNHSMHPLYMFLTKSILPYNLQVASKLQSENASFVNEILTSKNIESETESFQADLQISEYYASILDVQNFVATFKQLSLINPSSSLKMDATLCKIRISIIYGDKRMLKDAIAVGNEIVDRGCDWDRRNKFKVYKGFYHLLSKQYEDGALLFSEALTTFDSEELMSYEKCVFYLIFCALVSFDRASLLSKILKSSDVLETYKSNENGLKLVECIFNCEYNKFIDCLVPYLEDVRCDIFLNGQIDFFVKEIKLKIYKQLLESYRSLNTDLFCEVLKTGREYIEKDLSEFICEQRIECVIDQVNGVIHTVEANESSLEVISEKGERLMGMIRKNVK